MVRVERMYVEGMRVWSGGREKIDEASKRESWMLEDSIRGYGESFMGLKSVYGRGREKV